MLYSELRRHTTKLVNLYVVDNARYKNQKSVKDGFIPLQVNKREEVTERRDETA
jgi:hypothetical protein